MTHVEPQGELGLRITRQFRAPRHLVWDAYTKPELLQRWLGVRNGWTMDSCEVDLRVGGRYRWVWRLAAKNQQMGIQGVYREVTPPERLVCTERFDEAWYPGEALNTVGFREEAGVTTLTIDMLFDSAEAREGAARSGMERGLEESFLVLDSILAAGE